MKNHVSSNQQMCGYQNGTKTMVVIRTALAWISQLDPHKIREPVLIHNHHFKKINKNNQRTVKNLLFFAGSFTESAVSLSFGNNQNLKFFDLSNGNS